MEELVGLLIFGLIGRWIVVSYKIWSLKKRAAVAEGQARASEEQALNLTQRVHALESVGRVLAAPVLAAPVVVAAPSVPVVVPPPVPQLAFANICQFCGRSVTGGGGAVLLRGCAEERRAD